MRELIAIEHLQANVAFVSFRDAWNYPDVVIGSVQMAATAQNKSSRSDEHSAFLAGAHAHYKCKLPHILHLKKHYILFTWNEHCRNWSGEHPIYRNKSLSECEIAAFR